MSGGHFNYDQYKIGQIADDIQQLIDTNGSQENNSYGDPVGMNYPPEIIERFKEAVSLLRRSQIYAQRIDWLISGDDGEQSFLRRLEEELDVHA